MTLTDAGASPRVRFVIAMKRGDLRDLLIAAGVGVIGIAVVAPIVGSHTSSGSAGAIAPGEADTVATTVAPLVTESTIASGSTVPGSTVASDNSLVDVGGDTDEGCKITERSIRMGSTGQSVSCLQTALAAGGYYIGDINGTYDANTAAAVKKLQTEKDLFVDGIAGRETGLALGIWPDEASLVIHTPPPAPGAVDLMGYPLSSVAVSGPDAPPLPENSGEGRRLVYSRTGQRVWAVDENNVVVRSWLVAGSKYENETPGVHHVYSKSEVTTAWNGKAYLKWMVRYIKTDIGNIGFHQIPTHVADGTVYQTEAELGQRLSGGCQRQAELDALFVWDFATIGTTVVVV